MCKPEAELFRALGVESRLRIINLLKAKGQCCVNDLSHALGITPSAVSQHLKVLRHCGLVRSERRGYWIPYEVDPDALADCREALSKVCTCGCEGQEAQRTPGQGKAAETLDELKAHEQELRDELEQVRGRIDGLAKRG